MDSEYPSINAKQQAEGRPEHHHGENVCDFRAVKPLDEHRRDRGRWVGQRLPCAAQNPATALPNDRRRFIVR